MEKTPKSHFHIDQKIVGNDYPTYFIADIAANHDGDLERAKDLIFLAAESGADAAKFQHFNAKTIVSNKGFQELGDKLSHQSKWKKSVYEVYSDASIDLDWTLELLNTCKKAGISFFTSPYSFELVDYVDKYVPAYKIGSGDITWLEIINHISQKQKPYIIASGASKFDDILKAIDTGLRNNQNIALMQCNTNYTGSLENFKYINLNVLKTFRNLYPTMILGLSDHTPGLSTVLGAIALGARIIEKHFTDDISREGPDHKFSMNPNTWREMVERSRELERAMGNGIKKIEDNELDTVILQRRSIRLKEDIKCGSIISRDKLEVLRPCPYDAIPPNLIKEVLQRKASKNLAKGDYIKWSDLQQQ